MNKTLSAITLAVGLAAASVTGVADAKGKPGGNDLAPGGNIVEVAVAANGALGIFNTVLAAATCDYFDGAIVELLAGPDKVTLFAPTDGAFAKLGLDATNVCDAFAGDPSALAGILAYHVVDGRRFSNSVFNRNNQKSIEMLTGDVVTSNPDLTLTDGAGRTVGIVAPYFDINASNGVVHVIDTVLLPGG